MHQLKGILYEKQKRGTYEYAANMSIYSFPSGSHTLHSVASQSFHFHRKTWTERINSLRSEPSVEYNRNRMIATMRHSQLTENHFK